MAGCVVLVLAWNGERDLPACLTALLAQQCEQPFAVLVVDNGSTDGSVALVQRDFPQVALIQNDSNLGFGAGNNVGLRALLAGTAPAPITGVPDVVVLLNQDTEVAPDWLGHLLGVFERHADAGIAGCKLFFPDGTTLQHTGGTIEWPLATGRHRGAGEADSGQYDQEEAVEYVTGAAMALRTSMLQHIGLFDEGFAPAYFEDTDLCYRAHAAGYRIIYTPAATLLHHESTSLKAQSPVHQRAYHRNRMRFALKHGTLAALLHQFQPAEREEIERWSIRNSLARKLAYLDAMLILPDVLRQRADNAEAIAVQARLRDMFHTLHHTVIEEERKQRAETGYRLSVEEREAPATPDENAAAASSAGVAEAEAPPAAPADAVLGSPAPESDEPPSTQQAPEAKESEPVAEALTERYAAAEHTAEPPAEPAPPAPPPVDVAAIMRQVRRQISERQGRHVDQELLQTLDKTNQQWDKVYEPLHLPPGSSLAGRLWDVLRMRLHQEVRSYLDPMIYRQTELNANIVRTLNNIMRRSNFFARAAEIEALHDEIIQLREQVRQLQEQKK